jgi:hypothetical protein
MSHILARERLLRLYPYLLNGSCWVFDDERTGLKEEAFVLGASEMISRLVAARGLPDADRGFALSFSDTPFPGFDVELQWLRSDGVAGNWYAGEIAGARMEGWLCPALLLYFTEPPRRIFVRCDPLPAGVDPLWNPPPGATPRRFVEAPDRGALRPAP